MKIRVENFRQIESAEIDLSNFSIFVGENNSGKTYLMQLIYGILSFLKSNDFYAYVRNQNILRDDDDLESPIVFNLGDEGIHNKINEIVNECIKNNLEQILLKTFHTKNLYKDDLKVCLILEPISNKLVIKKNYNNLDENGFAYSTSSNSSPITFHYDFFIDDSSFWRTGFRKPSSITVKHSLSQRIILLFMSRYIHDILYQNREGETAIYIPASRSGMMLLYSNFISNRDSEIEIGELDVPTDEQISKKQDTVENKYGLTEPVYNFLTFLLNHKNSEIRTENNRDILEFINEKIINGTLAKDGNSIRYTPNNAESLSDIASERSIPIFLSSSLVSELAPIWQVLTGIQGYEYIFYDEIETCQHPTKQIELARMLIRMVNKGYKMIVSTHSCTMAAAIDNFLTLSSKKNRDRIAAKLGYEKADFTDSSNVHAYQFITEEGKTQVKELSNNFSIGLGFDFYLFNKANDKIFDDASELAEDF